MKTSQNPGATSQCPTKGHAHSTGISLPAGNTKRNLSFKRKNGTMNRSLVEIQTASRTRTPNCQEEPNRFRASQMVLDLRNNISTGIQPGIEVTENYVPKTHSLMKHQLKTMSSGLTNTTRQNTSSLSVKCITASSVCSYQMQLSQDKDGKFILISRTYLHDNARSTYVIKFLFRFEFNV
jgi:hypothetical protein